MKKISVISLVFIILFLAGCSINVSQIEAEELYQHSLELKEVKTHLGDQEIETYTISPPRSLTEEGSTFYPPLYMLFSDIKPSCLEEIELGEVIRRVQLNTPNRNIEVVYSAKNNKLICVLSYDKSKYED